MASSSIFKFANRVNGGQGRQLFWGRADIDGAPYRGAAPPMLPAEELDDRLVRVADPFSRIFDLSNEHDTKAYLDVMDKIVNQWAHMLYIKRVVTRNKKNDCIRVRVILEWVEFYMQDGQPMMSQRPYIGRQND